MPQSVCVTIVTYNSRKHIGRCLDAALRQEGVALDVVVVDNASSDGTIEILREFKKRIRIVRNGCNEGFAAAQNQAIALSSTDWILALNPDVLMEPDFVRQLVAAGSSDRKAGTVCGKLLSIGAGFAPLPERRIDSTGLYFTPQMRHFDRGWHEPDHGRFEQMEYVFGASAAAALYRREMIRDVSYRGEFFDPDFFAYREDADVAWRAQWLGWSCLYTPLAVAHHVRTVVPDNRRSVPAVLNMHSVKNRFLMRIKYCTPGLFRRYWLPMMMRDLVVVSGCVLREPSSLPAFWHLARCLGRTLERRRALISRRRVSDDVMADWIDTRRPPQPVETGVAVYAGGAD